MSLRSELRGRWRALRHGRRSDLEAQEEFRFHLEMETEKYIRSGLSADAARRRALLAFGGVDAAREAARDERGGRWVEDALSDLRLAARRFVHAPEFSAIVLLTLGLGIGASVAIFSVVDGVLLRPVPFADPDRLVMVWQTDRDSGTTREPASWPDFVDFSRETRTLSGLAALRGLELTRLPAEGDPERLSGVATTAGYFELVGVAPLVGRTFGADEAQPGGPRVVLLGERFWQRRFDADPALVGQTLLLGGEPHSVIGVLPTAAGFGLDQIHARAAYHVRYLSDGEVDVWLPLQADAESFPRTTHPFLVLGRLADGATLDDSRSELTALASELEKAYPDDNTARGTFVESLGEVVFAPIRPALLLLFAAVVLLLLVACVSVANLLLARGATRGREVALRASLGAGFGRLVRQFLAENALLAGGAALCGVGFAALGLELLRALAPADLPRLDEVAIDSRSLGFTLLVGVLVTLAFGMVALVPTRGQRSGEALKGEARQSTADRRRRRFRAALVVAQLALAVMLVIAAGLVTRSFRSLLGVDAGFRAEGVLKAEFQLPPTRYPRTFATWPNFAETHQFNAQLLERARAIPGVESAAVAASHGLDAGSTTSFVVVGREAEGESWPEISVRPVSPDYFAVMGLRIASGRPLAASDRTDGAPVAVINRTTAGKFFGGRDPIGQRLRFWGAERRIVGVVEDERFRGVAEEAPIAAYLPVTQCPASGVLVVRTTGDALALAPAVRQAIRSVDPELAVYGVERFADTVSASLAERRFTLVVLLVFAGVTLLLALVGVHGLLSYETARRTREIGIRAALGADRAEIVALVVRGGLALTGLGTLAGLAGAAASSRLLASLLFGVGALDLATYAGVSAAMLVAAGLACWAPAWRAARVEPVEALRCD